MDRPDDIAGRIVLVVDAVVSESAREARDEAATFCDLALHGGPPQRGADQALGVPGAAGRFAASSPRMLAEMQRGIRETTGLDAEPGGRRRADRVVTGAGRAFTLMLPPGEVLTPGALLYVGPGWYVIVAAAAEALLAVSPRSPREGIRVAVEVGRLHASLAVAGGRLLVPDEPAMERLLRRLQVSWARTHEPFVTASAGSPR